MGQQNGTQRVTMQLGAYVRKETVSRVWQASLDGVPNTDAHVVKVCTYSDANRVGVGSGCQEFTVDIRGAAVMGVRLVNVATK
jgi:hypothetical protein